jgi:hypothetical protein
MLFDSAASFSGDLFKKELALHERLRGTINKNPRPALPRVNGLRVCHNIIRSGYRFCKMASKFVLNTVTYVRSYLPPKACSRWRFAIASGGRRFRLAGKCTRRVQEPEPVGSAQQQGRLVGSRNCPTRSVSYTESAFCFRARDRAANS